MKTLGKISAEIDLLKDDMRHTFYLFKGYACMAKHRFELARECYEKAGSIRKLDEFASFNKQICEGIIKIGSGDYNSALRFFSMATILFPNNKNGHLYQSLAYISSYLKSKYIFSFTPNRDRRSFKKAETHLNDAVEKASNDAELHFYKGVFELHKHQFAAACAHFSDVLRTHP